MAASCDNDANNALAAAAKLEAQIDSMPLPPAPIELSSIRASLDAAKVTNAAADLYRRTKVQKAELAAEAARLDAESEALTKRMADRQKQKLNALASAKMPVEGLSFCNGVVTYNGLPYDQASDAERLRVSVAIAMATNPKLRVILVRNGSLLDEKGIRMLADLAQEKDYQIWLERVDSTGKVGVVLVDGEVATRKQGDEDAA